MLMKRPQVRSRTATVLSALTGLVAVVALLVGTVDAVVDFRSLVGASFQVNEKARSIVVELAPVRLGEPVIDLDASHVMNRDRGLLDRIGGVLEDSPTSEAWLYTLAEEKIAAAAAATDLVALAEQNTTRTVTAMLQALGYDQVEVRFTGPSSAAAADPFGAADRSAASPVGG